MLDCINARCNKNSLCHLWLFKLRVTWRLNSRVLAKSLPWQSPAVPNNCHFLTFHTCIAHSRANLLISSCNKPRRPLGERHQKPLLFSPCCFSVWQMRKNTQAVGKMISFML